MSKFNSKINQNGGDGYSVNVNEAIGGLPAYPRYSNNYKPVFEGSLLQNGGDGYSVNINQDIGGLPAYTRYTDNDKPIFNGSLLQNGSGCGCNSKNNSQDKSIFNLIKQQGGKNVKLTQFDAVKEVSQFLAPISLNSLKKLVTKIFLYDLSFKKEIKSKQLGGYSTELQKIIAPLGKSNLLVIAGLLLLHYFAVDKIKKNKENKEIKKRNLTIGGESFIHSITDIISKSGVNKAGSSILLSLLKDAFEININDNKEEKIYFNKKNKKNIFNVSQKGGNPLKDLIAPLGTNAFIATGLLIILEKIFTTRMKQIKSEDLKEKKLIGGKISKNYDKLLNLVTPLSFNTFATEKFLSMMVTKKNT